MNPGQISVYDDFTNGNLWTTAQALGAFPGYWTSNGSITFQSAVGGQNGIVVIPTSSILNANAAKVGGAVPLFYSNVTKIVARFVFAVSSIAYVGSNEAVLGFTHTGNSTADGSNNLYGAFLNFCPGYTATLPDWNTRALLTAPQLTGITFGTYGGTTTSGLAGFGYKPSTKVTSVAANTFYEGIISMVPGVSCAFYAGLYGSATLDQTCTVLANIPSNTLNTAGPIITMMTGGPGNLQVDKAQYAIWFTEGNKQLTDDQLYAL